MTSWLGDALTTAPFGPFFIILQLARSRTVGRFENKKSLIFFKSQAGLYGAHKNKIIHHILEFENISFHIGNAPRRGFFENFKIC